MPLAVIVPYYDNWLELQLCLQGFARQTDRDFRLILVNDGGDRFEGLIQQLASQHGLPLERHDLEPPSRQFRAGTARNLGLSRLDPGQFPRTLFLDSDCIPSADLVAQHQTYHRQHTAIIGCRRHIDRAWLSRMTFDDLGRLEDFVCRNDDRHRVAATDYRATFAHLKAGHTQFVVENAAFCWSCHLSVPTALTQALGGFWEALEGYGGEDQELGDRLLRAGCLLLARFDFAVYHLDHPRRSAPGGQNATTRRRQVLSRSRSEPELFRPGRHFPRRPA